MDMPFISLTNVSFTAAFPAMPVIGDVGVLAAIAAFPLTAIVSRLAMSFVPPRLPGFKTPTYLAPLVIAGLLFLAALAESYEGASANMLAVQLLAVAAYMLFSVMSGKTQNRTLSLFMAKAAVFLRITLIIADGITLAVGDYTSEITWFMKFVIVFVATFITEDWYCLWRWSRYDGSR